MIGEPLVDVFEREARAARGARADTRLLEESDDSDEGHCDDSVTGARAASEQADEETQEGGHEFASVGDFEVPLGWRALAQPAASQVDWDSTKKAYKWQKRKLAHIWDAPIGWQLASFSNWEKGMACFYYPSDKQKVLHELNVDEYGTDGHWVIIEKDY